MAPLFLYWNRPLGGDIGTRRLTVSSARSTTWAVPYRKVSDFVETELDPRKFGCGNETCLQFEGSSLLKEFDWFDICNNLLIAFPRLRSINFLRSNSDHFLQILIEKLAINHHIQSVDIGYPFDCRSVYLCLFHYTPKLRKLSIPATSLDDYDSLKQLLPRLHVLQVNKGSRNTSLEDDLGWKLISWMENQNSEIVVECYGLSKPLQDYIHWHANITLLSRRHRLGNNDDTATAIRVIKQWYGQHHRPSQQHPPQKIVGTLAGAFVTTSLVNDRGTKNQM